ncbi:MAG: hypothetical protein Q8P67_29295 [archaeon]|nr:hypothetical protein [archaeon]
MLSALAEVIGDVQLCHEYFSSSLITMLDQIADVGLQQKILSASFLQTLPGKFGMVWFLDFIIPHLINALFAPVQSVADVACNSLTRLTPLLGPVIAMRRLLMHIIALLTRPQTTVVVRAIIGISTHLGTDMIVQHIIPQLYHLLQEHSSRVSKGPRVLLSVLSTLSELLELLDRPSALQVFVIKSSLLFSCFLNPSPQSCESSQPSLIRFLAKLSSYIGPSHTKAHILPYISQYLTNYDGLYSKRGAWIGRDTDQVLKSIYSIQIASLIYAEFTPLIDRQTLLDEIPNFQNIESMIHVNQRNNAPVLGSSNLLLKTTRFEEAPASRNNPSSAGPLGSASVGSRGSLQLISMPQLESFSSPQMGGDLPESFAHLKWTTSLPYSDFPKKFCGKVAAVLRGGHTGGIRAMAHYNEQHMLTGSRDHTVRWWTIDDPRSAKRVYSKHKQAVQSVHFLDGGRLALSTAGSIHLWNPETLASVHTFNPDPDPFVCTVPFHSNSIQLIGCSSSSLHAIDPLCQSYRLNAFQNVWSLDSQNSGQIRCVARVPSINAVATGSSTGYITLIDMRTGIILFSWKGHDGAVLSLDAQESRLVSSSADRTLAAWNLLLSPPKLELARWGHSDAVSAFTFYDHQTLLSTSGSKLGLTSLSPNQALNRIAKVSKIPLFNAKAEKITALMSLPSHGVVVMGTDDGAIRIGY